MHSLFSTRRRIVLAFLSFSASIFFLSLLSSTSVRDKVRDYAVYPSFIRQKPLPETNLAQCRPEDYVSGYWWKRPTAKPVHTDEDAIRSSGFMGCASNREFGWHLGLGWDEPNEEFPRRDWRGNVSSYDWIPGEGCDTYRRIDRESLVVQLVEEGGWLILGDSVSEGHFHSLSCMLYPHVYATPDYVKNPYWDRAWPQYLYLNKSSPLVPHINFPEGFDIDKTPLALFRRVDLLLGKSDLTSIWKGWPTGNETGRDLFEGGSDVWDLDPSTYVPLFLAPLPEANFRTMIFNTAGHWTIDTLPGFNDLGYRQMLNFFELSMDSWIRRMVNMLEHAKEDDEAKRITRKKERQIIVRGYNPGHDACNVPRIRLAGPIKSWDPSWTHSYNWGWIRKFNSIFETIIKTWNHPNIHYLPLEQIGLLRPDAHVTSDCLHIMTGSGVIESWSEYVSYFLAHQP